MRKLVKSRRTGRSTTNTLIFTTSEYVNIDSRQLVVTRACADDVGAALKSVVALSRYKEVFDAAEALAGLTLKPWEMRLGASGSSFLR